MAIAKIRENIKDLFGKTKARTLRQKVGKKYAHVIRIYYNTFGTAFANSVNDVWKISSQQSQNICNPADLISITKKVGKQWISAGASKNRKIEDVYDLGDGLEIILLQSSETLSTSSLESINRDFREDIWNEFEGSSNSISRDTEVDIRYGDEKYGARDSGTEFSTIGAAVAFGTGFSHDEGTNVAKASLVEFLEGFEPGSGGDHQTESLDIAEFVLSRLGIEWKKERTPGEDSRKLGKDKWVITGELAGYNKPWLSGTDLGKEWEQRVLDALKQSAIDAAEDGYKDMEGSKSFSQVATEAAVLEIVKPYKRLRDEKGRFVKMTGVPTKARRTRQGGKVANPLKKATRKSKGVKVLRSTAVSKASGKEKGAAPKSTNNAAQLLRLKKYIQSRLPAEVRRNMGRPALINQTGRFSNSVQLLNLMEGKNTLMAKYTYLLSPYQTFETPGNNNWPSSYNPKDLIEKSIRNLAVGRISQKLILDRT